MSGSLASKMPGRGCVGLGSVAAWSHRCYPTRRDPDHTSRLAIVPPCSAATYRIMRIPRIGGIYQLTAHNALLPTLLRHAAVWPGKMTQLATPHTHWCRKCAHLFGGRGNPPPSVTRGETETRRQLSSMCQFKITRCYLLCKGEGPTGGREVDIYSLEALQNIYKIIPTSILSII